MCGIAGACSTSGPRPIAPDMMARMISALRHRGPDGSGIYLDDRVGLGHARLSIIDVERGAQPLSNEDGSLWIVLNGEIFNYVELRTGLLARGHRFATATDTEVILHLFEEKGDECLEELNGQFAFALWDGRDKRLFLARDRTGILPLHYALADGLFLFASEAKALFASRLIAPRLDPVALDQVFTFWTTLPGRTAFAGVSELPPGRCLTLSGGRPAVRRYWELPWGPPGEEREERDLGLLAEEGRALIEDAVRIRLRADVPVGCYVSGGLDSSSVAALVKTRFDHAVRTFGITFEEKAFDERDHQEFVVEHLRTGHTAVEATNALIGAAFPEVVCHAERPLLRTAPAPLFLLSQAVRDQGVKVVLTGEGADEVFGGYDIFKEAKVRAFWAKHPASKSRPRLIGRLYPDIFRDPRLARSLETFFSRGMEAVTDPFYSHRIRWEGTARLKTFFSEDFRSAAGGYRGLDEVREGLPRDFDRWDFLARAQYLETTIFLSNYLLSSQGDRVAMAHGVEIRPPFLDHRLIAFMGRVPPWWKIRGLQEKYLLRKCLAGLLPERILGRPKHPYRAPAGRSLLAEGNGDSPEAGLLSGRALADAGLFDPPKVRALLQKVRAGAPPGEFGLMALAGILSTQVLHDRFIRPVAAPPARPVIPGLLIDRRTAVT